MTQLYLFLMMFFLRFDVPHEYYFGLTKIDINDNCETAEITIRLFADDTEKAIKTKGNILIVRDFDIFNSAIQEYVLANFKAEGIDNIQFIGFETDADMYVIYLELNIKGLKEIQLSNELLMDVIPKQINITHVKHRQKIKTYTFDSSNKTQKIIGCGL